MLKRVSYEVTYMGVLKIYYGNKLLTEYQNTASLLNMSNSELKLLVKHILNEMGYKWLWNGRLELKNVKLGKVEYKDGISKNIAPKSEAFINRWNVLVEYIIKTYGLFNVLFIREEDENVFSVQIRHSRGNGRLSVPHITLYIISKRRPAVDITADFFKGYYIWV